MPRPTRRTRSISPAAATRASPGRARRTGVNLFDVVAEHVKAANAAGRRVLVAGYTEGSASRLQHLLQEHGATTPVPVPDFATVQGLPIRRARRRRLAGRARLRAGWPGGHRRRGHHRRSAVAAGQEAAAVRALHRRGRGLERGRPRRASRARRRPLRGPGHAGHPARTARLPQADLRRRRQALRAGREHRRAEPLRLGGGGRGARPAGRRRLAVAQGAGSSSASPTWPTG